MLVRDITDLEVYSSKHPRISLNITFVMFKEIVELNKNNADQKVMEPLEIIVKTSGSVRQVRVNNWPYCKLAR